MLKLTIGCSEELYDERRNCFIEPKKQVLQLEHSLVSVSKWEAIWNKVFLSNEAKTMEETVSYVKCMTLTQNVSPDVYSYLTNDNLKEINQYIAAPMTATFLPENRDKNGCCSEPLTSELIYYWMIMFHIPVEFQKWHLNRLLMLIRVCDFKNTPVQKQSRSDMIHKREEINRLHREMLNSKG